MSSREVWAAYIKESITGRFSYLRGHARLEIDQLPLGEDVEKFMRSLTARDPDRKLLFYLYLLQRPEFQSFLSTDLAELLKAASHQSQVEKQERRGGIRGQIDWPSTLRLRMTARPDPSFFVSRVASRTSNTPENQLIKHFLRLTEEVSSFIVNRMKTGSIYQNVIEIREKGRSLQKHPYIRDLRPGPMASVNMKARARRHRDSRYHVLLTYVEEMEALARIWSWSSALELIREGYLSPISDDDLFELYVLIKCFDVLENGLGYGEPKLRCPIVEGRSAVAVYESPSNTTETVSIYFDQGPSSFGFIDSEYPRIARAYSLAGSERRPDISVVHQAGDVRRILLIEMKKSEDRSYGRDSIYKAMAYLRDFSRLWLQSAGTHPKVALVFPVITAGNVSYIEASEDLVLVSAESNVRLTATISNFLNPPVD